MLNLNLRRLCCGALYFVTMSCAPQSSTYGFEIFPVSKRDLALTYFGSVGVKNNNREEFIAKLLADGALMSDKRFVGKTTPTCTQHIRKKSGNAIDLKIDRLGIKKIESGWSIDVVSGNTQNILCIDILEAKKEML